MGESWESRRALEKKREKELEEGKKEYGEMRRGEC